MEQAIVITRSQLRQAIEAYIAASRVGETLSYVETAKLSAAEVAESSTERLWGTLQAQDSVPPTQFEQQAAAMPGAVAAEPEKQEFTCAEDLVAGQVAIVNSRGFIEGKRDGDSKVLSDKSAARIEFGFFQAEQLHSMFGGDTDTKVTLLVSHDKRMHAHITDYPEEGAIELIDTVSGEPEPPSTEDNDSLFA